MDIHKKISQLSIDLYISISEDDHEYMEVLIDVIERECLIDNEYLFSIYEIILEWRKTKNKPIDEFAYELYEYLNDF
jgi:hypothetical protein